MNLRNKVGLLFYFPFLFFVSFQSYGAKTNNGIANLFDTPISSKAELYSAVDSQGNTWVKGAIPDPLLNIAALFQIPSVHVSDVGLCHYLDLLSLNREIEQERKKITVAAYPETEKNVIFLDQFYFFQNFYF